MFNLGTGQMTFISYTHILTQVEKSKFSLAHTFQKFHSYCHSFHPLNIRNKI
jgi:hypothetical protein